MRVPSFDALSPVRVAIVGTGAIASSAHLPAVLRSPHLELVALVDRRTEHAEALAHKHGLHCRVSSELAPVLSAVDAVIIATPPESHFSLAELALQNDVAAFIEKPMTISYVEALKLCDLAESRKNVLAIGYYSRCHPSVMLMKELLQSRFFGDIHSFHLEHGTTGNWQPLSGYNLDRRQSGGGALISNGTHFLDRLIHWFGEPSHFTYADDSYGGPEANCKAELHYDNHLGRFTGSVFISSTIPLKNKFVLDTEKYVCERTESQSQSLTILPKDNSRVRYEVFPNVALPIPEPDYFQTQLELFAGSVRHKCEVAADGRSGAMSVRLIEQMYGVREKLEEPWLLYRKGDRVKT